MRPLLIGGPKVGTLGAQALLIRLKSWVEVCTNVGRRVRAVNGGAGFDVGVWLVGMVGGMGRRWRVVARRAHSLDGLVGVERYAPANAGICYWFLEEYL